MIELEEDKDEKFVQEIAFPCFQKYARKAVEPFIGRAIHRMSLEQGKPLPDKDEDRLRLHWSLAIEEMKLERGQDIDAFNELTLHDRVKLFEPYFWSYARFRMFCARAFIPIQFEKPRAARR